jgi:hypothetical protein
MGARAYLSTANFLHRHTLLGLVDSGGKTHYFEHKILAAFSKLTQPLYAHLSLSFRLLLLMQRLGLL